MKHKTQTKQLVTMLAVVAGLTLASSTQAQYITGGQYLQNATTSGGYGGWSSATYNYTATGIEVGNADATAYGGAYFVINSGVQALNANDTAIQLTLTLNGTPAAFNYFSPGQLVLNDNNAPNSGPWYYGMPYFGYEYNPNNANVTWSPDGSTYTITVPITGGLLSNIQAGGDHIYSFSLDMDPTGQVPQPYDVTFNSIQLIPEPATMSLLGVGLLGLLGLCRRK